MLPGETILSGAPATCSDCGLTPKLEVLRSAAGFYIGTRCNCGPYSRESGYYPDSESAAIDLREQSWVPRSSEYRGR